MLAIELAPRIKYVLCGFTLGQILALCNTGTGVTSQLLTDEIKVIQLLILSHISIHFGLNSSKTLRASLK